MSAHTDIDYLYGLLTENHLDLMYLPSGAVAWLHGRPETQIQSAARVGVIAKDANPVVNARLLRADQNVLVLHCRGGQKFMIYPDGGIGFDGQPVQPDDIERLISNMPDAEACGCAHGDEIPSKTVITVDEPVDAVEPEELEDEPTPETHDNGLGGLSWADLIEP